MQNKREETLKIYLEFELFFQQRHSRRFFSKIFWTKTMNLSFVAGDFLSNQKDFLWNLKRNLWEKNDIIDAAWSTFHRNAILFYYTPASLFLKFFLRKPTWRTCTKVILFSETKMWTLYHKSESKVYFHFL
jgi:hypothetical protein